MRWLLVALVALSGPGAAVDVTLTPPSHAPLDGTPFEVHVRVTGLTGDARLKVWLGGDDWQASRTWDGATWTRSDRYAVEVRPDADGAWDAWVALAANPEGANAPRLREAALATVGARVRTGEDAWSAAAHVDASAALDHVLVGLPVGAAGEAWSGNDLVAHRSNTGDRPMVARLAVPAGSDVSLCVAETCTPASGVRLAEVASDHALVENIGPVPADVTGAVVTLDDGACALEGVLAPGARSRVACDPTDIDAPRGQLLHLGELLDAAPQLPGWGATVREPWGAHRWAPWRLPEGVVPAPIETLDVRGAAKPFETRREGLDTVAQVIEHARHRLTVVTYLFTNDLVADALVQAATRGVDVRVLVEPDPVGGRPPEEDTVLGRLRDAGVDVAWATGPWSARGVQHAKVIVADGCVVLVLTENLTRSGLPPDGRGNVGWGIGIANATLARRVERAFGAGGPSASWSPPGWEPFDAPITLLWSPENAWRVDGVPALLAATEGPVRGIALEAAPAWGPRPNAWLDALANASERRRVQLLLNGVAQGQPVPANEDVIAYLAARPGAGQLEVRASDPSVGVVHGKGIVTSQWALVGSSNWGLGGALLNRELNLVVHDPQVAAFYATSFDGLWAGEEGAPAAAPMPAILVLVAASIGAAVRLADPGALPRRSRASAREREVRISSEAEHGLVADRVDDAEDGRRGICRDQQPCNEKDGDHPPDQATLHGAPRTDRGRPPT